MKPRFEKRKHTNKLEPQAVPCFYVGPSPNRPCDSMQVIFFSGTIVDSWDITWASIPPLASVVCEQGGPTGTVEGRTRGDFRRLQAVHSAGLLAGEVGLVSVREDSASRATQRELVGNAMFSAEEIGIKTARIAFVSETQYMKDFLNSMDVDGSL